MHLVGSYYANLSRCTVRIMSIVACSEIHKKTHKYSVYNVETVIVEPDTTYSSRLAIICLISYNDGHNIDRYLSGKEPTQFF